MRAPDWLSAVAWLYLSVCFCCAGVIVWDIVGNARRQTMAVMNAVFPMTALYLGPVALALYWRWGRAAVRAPGDDALAQAAHRSRPGWVTMAFEVSHCGAGCSIGDLISEFAIFGLGLTIAGVTLPAEYVGDYVLALVFGIVFQYFAIAPMRGLRLKAGLVAAAKADFISLTAFEVGLFGWMAVVAFVFFPAPHALVPSFAAYWLLMQVGMIVGFVTSWPANVWLVKRSIKQPM